ncbi:MAG: PIN domain-containing protein [Cytophagales bacterium]|nr:PIN domain-containing protein [Cytophagales bacterium]
MSAASSTVMVLVDTCAWIDFLRNSEGTLGDQVAQLIAEGRAHMCGAVVAELLQGIKKDASNKSKQEAAQLQLLIERIPTVETIEADWYTAGHTLQSLRQKGITLPLTDALIASIAKRNNLTVLTIDAHFKHLGV